MMYEDSLAHASWMVQEEHSVKDAGLCCSSWLMCGPYVRYGRRVQTYEVSEYRRVEQRRSSRGDQEKISNVGLVLLRPLSSCPHLM